MPYILVTETRVGYTSVALELVLELTSQKYFIKNTGMSKRAQVARWKLLAHEEPFDNIIGRLQCQSKGL